MGDKQHQSQPNLRTPRELAAALQLKPQTINKYCREGRIECITVGRLYRIPEAEFDRIVREGVPQEA